MIRTSSIRRTRDRARRSNEQRRKLSRWKVTRPGPGTTDADTGNFTPGGETVWEGNAFYSDTSRPYMRSRADTTLTVQEPTLSVPHDAPRLLQGDVVEAVEADDVTLLERSWRITGEPGSSYGTDRDYPLEEVT